MPDEKGDRSLKKLLDENLEEIKQGGVSGEEKKIEGKPETKKSPVFSNIKGKYSQDERKEAVETAIPSPAEEEATTKPSGPEKPESKFIKSVLERKLKQGKEEKERIPAPKELEAEWEEKLKEAQRKEGGVLKLKRTGRVREEKLEDVFERLRKREEVSKAAEGKGDERLDKISGAIKGEAPELERRELTGEKIPFIYRIYSIGELPPLNLLSKVYKSSQGKNLELVLETTNIPLYSSEYCSFVVAMGFILALSVFILLFVLTSYDLIISLLSLALTLIGVSFLLLIYPTLKIKASSRNIDKQLPFALRHMSSLLSAGISIFDSIVSVSKADYGALSHELDEVVWEVKSGESLSDALEESGRRVKSKAYTRVIVHIRRALQMGGNIADIISQIADDLTFEMRMKVTDFVEKLNAFAIVYLIGGIVGPVVVAIFSVVNSLPMYGAGGSPESSIVLLLVLFPMMMGIIIYVVKIIEPKV